MPPLPHTLTHLYVALGFMLANKERLIWDMKISGSLDYSEHKMVEYRITMWTSGFLQLNEQQKENQGKGTPGAEWSRRSDEKGMENAKVIGTHFTSLFTDDTCH